MSHHTHGKLSSSTTRIASLILRPSTAAIIPLQARLDDLLVDVYICFPSGSHTCLASLLQSEYSLLFLLSVAHKLAVLAGMLFCLLFLRHLGGIFSPDEGIFSSILDRSAYFLVPFSHHGKVSMQPRERSAASANMSVTACGW